MYDSEGMRKMTVNYYRDLLKWEPRHMIDLKEYLISKYEKITTEENGRLVAIFSIFFINFR